MKPTGFICSPPIYEFEGWIFEYHQTSVWPLTKDYEPRKRAGRKFYAMLDRFCTLTDDQKKEYRVGGGCAAF